MSDNAAASETGYYYIAGVPVNNNRNSYIYYYDMVKDMTIPLCSKMDCYHRTEECIQSCVDSDGNIYFACVGDNKYIVRKLNISTGDIKDIYSQEMQHEKDYRYVSLKNYDGKYLYIYKNVNGEALDGKNIEEKLKKYDNNIYILDTDGNVKDTVTLNGTDDTASGNISGEFYGGDDRCLLIVFSTYGIKGLELSEEKTVFRAELIEEARKNKKGSPVVSISAILDKSQIGSGAITLEQITPE